MTTEMHECELHLAQVFAHAWDEPFVQVAKAGHGELEPAFFEEVYQRANALCSTFDNFDIQFDTIDTCFKFMPASAPLAGIVYVVEISYQIDETIFSISLYYGEARSADMITREIVHHGRYIDVLCRMSASEEEKEVHMLEHFAQLQTV
ncbi:MAG: hypothetical protein HWE34_09595 [Methylocystaceae bacterium]|nr:hypothetical protein [Methylocystaceae bacterium]